MMTTISYIMIGRDISLYIVTNVMITVAIVVKYDHIVWLYFTSMMRPMSIVMKDHFKSFDKPLYLSW